MKKTILLPTLALACILFACTKGPKEEPTPEPVPDTENARINGWIYDQLAGEYYWHDRLAAKNSVSTTLAPIDYFYSLLWNDDRQAGFSRIEAAPATRGNATTGQTTDFGWLLMRWTYRNSPVNTMQVMYVVPGSPAERAGIRRGDMFSHCNGTEITTDNYSSLFNAAQLTLTRCDDRRNPIGQVTVAKGSFYDTPVLRDTVYRMADGKNIGYLFYDRFESAKGSADDPDLRAAIGRIKAANADELILDLRYNGGGYLDISTELATMLLPAEVGTDNIYLYEESGPQTGTPMRTVRFSNRVNSYRLNLKLLHVITSGNTASASEITAHGLKQYMPVVLYGMQTRGKNVGSYEISGKNQNIPWNLYPITMHLYDSRGKGADNWQTFTGLVPDYTFDEIDGGQYSIQGQLGEYDPAKGTDCDPLLNFVMARLGYAPLLERSPSTRSAGGDPTPHLISNRPQVLIVSR